MPQLDISTFFSQTFWSLFAVIVVDWTDDLDDEDESEIVEWLWYTSLYTQVLFIGSEMWGAADRFSGWVSAHLVRGAVRLFTVGELFYFRRGDFFLAVQRNFIASYQCRSTFSSCSFFVLVGLSTFAWGELVGFFFLLLLSVILVILMYVMTRVASVLVKQTKNFEQKLSAYECGFDAFDDARMQFDVRYYLVAILFLLFDIEIIFILPWAVYLPALQTFGFWIMELFMLIVTVGFMYEYYIKALDWENA